MTSALLQRLVVNFSGKVRRAKYQGRDYLVAPMTLINPGVLNGSKGSLLYPPDEVAKNPRQWNGVPIVVYHPHRLGQPVSATEPGILDSQGIGVIRNATSNGKLRAEGWFDVQKTQRINPTVYQKLLKSEPIELSTGLFTDNEDTSGTFNGRQYTAIARNYRPDHLAVLPDQIGACSVKDGCGVLVNKERQMKLQDKLSSLLSNREVPGREDMQDSDFAGPDRSFPIKTQEDLDAAVHSIGRSTHSPATIKAGIERIAKRKGLKLPDNWESNCDQKMAVKNQSAADAAVKKADASRVVALKSDRPEDHAKAASDCLQAAACHDLIAGAADSQLSKDPLEATKEYLNMYQEHLSKAEKDNGETMVDVQTKTNNSLNERLAVLVGNAVNPDLEKDHNNVKQTNNKRGGQTMAKDTKLTAEERKAVVDGLIANEECCWEESDREVLNTLNDGTLAKLHRQAELVKNAGASADQLDKDAGTDVAAKDEKTKKGQAQADGKEQPTGELDPKMKNNQQGTVTLNEQDRQDLAFARRYRMEQRQQYVKAITANANNKFTAKQLDAMDDTVLANMAALVETKDEEGSTMSFRPSFFGQQGAAVVNANAGADEEPLTLGRIDYKELAASNGSHK